MQWKCGMIMQLDCLIHDYVHKLKKTCFLPCWDNEFHRGWGSCKRGAGRKSWWSHCGWGSISTTIIWLCHGWTSVRGWLGIRRWITSWSCGVHPTLFLGQVDKSCSHKLQVWINFVKFQVTLTQKKARAKSSGWVSMNVNNWKWCRWQESVTRQPTDETKKRKPWMRSCGGVIILSSGVACLTVWSILWLWRLKSLAYDASTPVIDESSIFFIYFFENGLHCFQWVTSNGTSSFKRRFKIVVAQITEVDTSNYSTLWLTWWRQEG